MNEETNYWTQKEAVDLCIKIEAVCPSACCHVALTGGLLYKDGARKDCDILFYRIRQAKEIDMLALLYLLSKIGIKPIKSYGFVLKAEYNEKKIDMFFPEYQDGDYVKG